MSKERGLQPREPAKCSTLPEGIQTGLSIRALTLECQRHPAHSRLRSCHVPQSTLPGINSTCLAVVTFRSRV